MQLEISTNVFDTTIITFDHCFTSPYWRERKFFPEVYSTGFQSLPNSE